MLDEEPTDSADDALEQQLRRAVELYDSVPPRSVRAAIEAFTWRTIDAELAELVFDSLVSPAAVRGSGDTRLFTFETETLTIEVEVSATSAVAGDVRRVSGRLVPAQRAEVELQVGEQRVNGTSNPLGHFAMVAPGRGPFRLHCRPNGQASPVVTEWVA